jgi:hypothetical protein
MILMLCSDAFYTVDILVQIKWECDAMNDNLKVLFLHLHWEGEKHSKLLSLAGKDFETRTWCFTSTWLEYSFYASLLSDKCEIVVYFSVLVVQSHAGDLSVLMGLVLLFIFYCSRFAFCIAHLLSKTLLTENGNVMVTQTAVMALTKPIVMNHVQTTSLLAKISSV